MNKHIMKNTAAQSERKQAQKRMLKEAIVQLPSNVQRTWSSYKSQRKLYVLKIPFLIFCLVWLGPSLLRICSHIFNDFCVSLICFEEKIWDLVIVHSVWVCKPIFSMAFHSYQVTRRCIA
jgi:hypothetical protein